MKVHVTELLEGDRLSNDIFNPYGLNVLSQGTLLHAQEISKLFQHRIDYVDIVQRETLTSSSSDGDTQETDVKQVYRDAVIQCEALFAEARLEGRIDPQAVDATFQPLAETVQQHRDVVSMLLQLNTKDDYTYQHSVQVGMLSYYLANWMGMDESEASIAGKAGFLHDIGKCRIENAILNKPGKLTAEEFAEIKKHPLYGYEIIRQSFEDEQLAIPALQHHERMDGSGYPGSLEREEITPISRIVAIADVYSAMISSRVYQQSRDLLYVLRELHLLSFGQLDPHAVHCFIGHMIPNFIGKQVELMSGRTGIIVMTNANDYFRPLIQLEEGFLDLSLHPEDAIVHIRM
ncbi:HD-GYP domain-containing protein [Paenibacillus sp. 1P07SE]|uniref:HD-GYP domain-containing protein n=1 Tax=Paenibacillus sp. 1P07SE TaxID=3132209 RepID=UPI0039A51293